MKINFLYIFILVVFSSNGQNIKPLSELINTSDSGWPLVQDWIKSAEVKVEILSRDLSSAESNLLKAQITTRSSMGSVVYETGGIIVENGLLRILGSGSKNLNRGIMDWNLNKSFKENEKPKFLLIADDIFGGFFGINGGALSNESIGKIFYLSPDSLKWENLDLSYSDFLNFCFSKKINKFYDAFKWKTFGEDTLKFDNDKAFSFYPYLFTEEGKDIEKVSKKMCSIQEIWELYNNLQKQLFKE
jgi:hypothetical protein